LHRRQPDNVNVRVDLARAEDQLGQQSTAMRILDEVLAQHPHSQPALAERGLLAMRAGQSGQAEIWLRKACGLFRGNYQTHYQLALCLTQNGKSEEARKVQTWLKQLEEDNMRLRDIVAV